MNVPERAGWPLHLVSPEEGILKSFGAEARMTETRSSDLFYRQLAPGSSSEFWAAHLTAYVLERYDASGTLISRLRREVDWFPPHDDFGSVGPDDPPSPGLRALHVDDDGHVRIVISVPDPEWRNALTPTVDRFGQDSYEYRRSAVYDTVVEIIDPERSIVVGQATLDAAVLGFTPGGLLYALEEAGNLEPYVRVWRVSGRE